METSKICILVEDRFGDVPSDIKTLENYGDDAVMCEGDCTRGKVMIIEGASESIKSWLKPFNEIWVSNSPMTGEWTLLEVK